MLDGILERTVQEAAWPNSKLISGIYQSGLQRTMKRLQSGQWVPIIVTGRYRLVCHPQLAA